MNHAPPAHAPPAFDAGPQSRSSTAPSTARNRLLLLLKKWWGGIRMDTDTAFLSMAIDHADLERRLRTLEERDRRDRVPMY